MMLHPSLHGYLVDQHQRELERAAERERLLVEARSATADAPSVTQRTMLGLGRLLIDVGLHLSARYPTEAQRTLPQALSHDRALSPLSAWTPAMLAHVRNVRNVPNESGAALTLLYYGFVTVGPRGITHTAYAMPLARPVASRRPSAEERG